MLYAAGKLTELLGEEVCVENIYLVSGECLWPV